MARPRSDQCLPEACATEAVAQGRFCRPLPRLADGAEPEPVKEAEAEAEADHELDRVVHWKSGPIHGGLRQLSLARF